MVSCFASLCIDRALEMYEEQADGQTVVHQPGSMWMMKGPCEYVPPVQVQVVETRQVLHPTMRVNHLIASGQSSHKAYSCCCRLHSSYNILISSSGDPPG